MLQSKKPIILAVVGVFVCVSLIFSILHSAVADWDLFIGMVSAFVLSCLAIILAVRRRPVATLLIVGFLLRLGVSVLYTVYIGDPDPDGYGYNATQMLESGVGGLLQNIPLGAYFYSWIVAWVWMVFGESYFLIRVISAFLSFLALVIAYDLSRKLFSSDVAKKLLVVGVFFPSLIRFSGLFAGREAISVLFVMLIAYFTYQLYAKQKLRYLLGVLVCILVASILHTGFFVYGITIVSIILLTKFRNGKKALMLIPALVITVGMGVWMFSSGIGTEKLYLTDGSVDADRLIALQDGSRAEGRAAYLTDSGPTNIAGSVLSLPVRFAYFLFAPFPWMIRSAIDIVGFLDAIAYLALVWYILKARKQWRFDKNKLFFNAMMVALIITIAGFAIGTSNYGTALRHRAKFALPMIVLAGAGLRSYERRRA